MKTHFLTIHAMSSNILAGETEHFPRYLLLAQTWEEIRPPSKIGDENPTHHSTLSSSCPGTCQCAAHVAGQRRKPPPGHLSTLQQHSDTHPSFSPFLLDFTEIDLDSFYTSPDWIYPY